MHSNACTCRACRRQPLKRLYKAKKGHGLLANWSKSNTMVFSKEHTECKMEVDGVCIEQAGDGIPRGKTE